MYSRNTARKNIVQPENEFISVPPNYDGVRFSRRMRSDGRSEGFEEAIRDSRGNRTEGPAADKKTPPEAAAYVCDGPCLTEAAECENDAECSADEGINSAEPHAEGADREKLSLAHFLSGLKDDDILIIGLIVILAGERGEKNREVLLLLVLLLCCR